jgi:type I restriction enzyme S subunit
MKKISQDTAMGIPFPTSLPIQEQRRIVAQLDLLEKNIDAVRCLQDETKAELDALLPAVLDRAFKGELV